MKTKSEMAQELFDSGFNCSQSVVAVFCEKYGVSQEVALKMSSGFGGGVRFGEICGAASGAVLVIGLKYGQYKAEDKEAKSNCNLETVNFLNEFRNRNKSIVCRDILGYDISITYGMEQAQAKNLFKTVCVDMVISAVNILEGMGL